MKHNRRGFTLIELLVVVLIIGILSAIALPQYEKTVERSRATEALLNLNTLKKAIDLYLLSIGTPTDETYFTGTKKNIDLDIDLSCLGLQGITDDQGYCFSKNFGYMVWCTNSTCEATAFRYYSAKKQFGSYYFSSIRNNSDSSWTDKCLYENDAAKKVCLTFANQNFILEEY